MRQTMRELCNESTRLQVACIDRARLIDLTGVSHHHDPVYHRLVDRWHAVNEAIRVRTAQ